MFSFVELIVYDFSMMRAACAIKIAYDNCRQKSYRVNRPLTHAIFGAIFVTLFKAFFSRLNSR